MLSWTVKWTMMQVDIVWSSPDVMMILSPDFMVNGPPMMHSGTLLSSHLHFGSAQHTIHITVAALKLIRIKHVYYIYVGL